MHQQDCLQSALQLQKIMFKISGGDLGSFLQKAKQLLYSSFFNPKLQEKCLKIVGVESGNRLLGNVKQKTLRIAGYPCILLFGSFI